MESAYCVLAFQNTHAALSAQKALAEAGLSPLMIPTLREITASCGISLRFQPEELTAVLAILGETSLDRALYRLYAVSSGPGIRSVRPLDESEF